MLKFKRLVVIGACLAMVQAEGTAWADGSLRVRVPSS